MLITVAFVLMAVMFFAGMYVAGALGSVALILLNLFSDNPVWNIMGNRAWETNTNVNLVAIPLFILMGEIVLRSGFADLMYRALSRWVDFIPGGLMHTNIASCAVFAACAGSSIATAATVSRVALPSFRAQGYQERLVVGSLAAGGTLGILIPPSILLVLYGLTVGESIGRLFLAGFIPGFLLALVFMVMIGIISVIWPAIAPRHSGLRFWTWEGWIERLLFTLLMIPVLALVFIVLGSIYFGWATPSEAAGFGVAGSLALAIIYNFARLFTGDIAAFLLTTGIASRMSLEVRAVLEEWRSRERFDWQTFRNYCRFILMMALDASVSASRSSAMIMFILMAAFTLQFAFAYLRISITMAEWVAGFETRHRPARPVPGRLLPPPRHLHGSLFHDANHAPHHLAGAARRRRRSPLVRHHHDHPPGSGPDQPAPGFEPLRAPGRPGGRRPPGVAGPRPTGRRRNHQ